MILCDELRNVSKGAEGGLYEKFLNENRAMLSILQVFLRYEASLGHWRASKELALGTEDDIWFVYKWCDENGLSVTHAGQLVRHEDSVMLVPFTFNWSITHD